MKKQLRGFILGAIITTLLMSTAVGAAVKKTIEVTMNSVNITVNGKKVAADNIAYNGTTYVPLRAISEILDKEVGWDQSTKTASINDKGVATKPTTLNYNRTNPAPIGVNQIINVSRTLDEYTADITIKEYLRGEAAWELIKEANMFNDEPEADEDYILVKVNIKVYNVKDDKKVDISPVHFDIYSENNVEYNSKSTVAPEPRISTSLYEGGQHEGYAAYIVKKSDANPKLVYGQKYDGTGGIWFRLSK